MNTTKIKQQVILDLSNDESKLDIVYMHCGDKSYTRREIIHAFKTNEAISEKIIEDLILLTVDLLNKGRI